MTATGTHCLILLPNSPRDERRLLRRARHGRTARDGRAVRQAGERFSQ